MRKEVSAQFDQLLAEVNEATRQVGVKVDEVGGKVDAGFGVMATMIEKLVNNADRFQKQPPQGLKPYLLDWWFDKIGDDELDVDNDTFLNKLVDTMQSLG